METQLPLFPEAASTAASGTDALYVFLVVITAVFSIGIFTAITALAIRFRRQALRAHSPAMKAPPAVEAVWIVIPFVLAMIMFGWGAKLFYENNRTPESTLDIYVVAKQWMWKLQHPGGRREINELHIPTRRPIKLIMTSQDVIHSFYVPAFRLKQDVVPGRYTTMWFEALRPGRYHLFCAEYCGTSHSEMTGTVVAMKPSDYEEWLSAGQTEHGVSRGEALFRRLRCDDCHRDEKRARGPGLRGLFDRTSVFSDETSLVPDENYFRQSLMEPSARLVSGFDNIMPSYRNLVNEQDVTELIRYVRSLGQNGDTP